MPRKKKDLGLSPEETPVKQGKYYCPPDAPWGGFINVSLNEGDKAAFHEWQGREGHHTGEMLDDLMGEGMKYGVSYDQENQCYIVTLTGSLVERANLRCSVTTRAGTWGEANELAIWKHFILCAGNYGDLLTTGRKRDWG